MTAEDLPLAISELFAAWKPAFTNGPGQTTGELRLAALLDESLGMLNRLRARWGQPPAKVPAAEIAHRLDNKPYATALLALAQDLLANSAGAIDGLLASKLGSGSDEANLANSARSAAAYLALAQDLEANLEKSRREMIGAKRKSIQEISIDSAAEHVAFDIASAASVKLGLMPCYLPGTPPSQQTHLLVAFSLLVLQYIRTHLSAEGIETNYSDMSMRTALMFSPFHSPDESAKLVFEAFGELKQAVKSSWDGADEWDNHMTKLVFAYVRAWPYDDELPADQLKKGFAALLGQFLTRESAAR